MLLNFSVDNYKIFRNDTLVGITDQTSYIDNVVADNNYCYRVESICDYGMFSSSNEVCIYVESHDEEEGEEGNAIEVWNADNISVYPNPTYGYFFVEGPQIGIVRIFNASGQLVIEIENDDAERVNVVCEGWNPGMYNIQIISKEGQTITRKVSIFR